MILIAKNVTDVENFKGINLIVDFFRFSTTVVSLSSRFKKIKIFSQEKKLFYYLTKNISVFSEKDLGIDKFDNSPYLAYTQNYFEEVYIITESGSKAVMASKNAKEVVILSLSNLDAVKNYIYNKKEDILLVPASIFFNKNHVEDFIFCKYFLDYFVKDIEFDENSLYIEIEKTLRINEILKLRKTAKEDLKIIFSKNIFEIVPIAKLYLDFAEVCYESSCKLFWRT